MPRFQLYYQLDVVDLAFAMGLLGVNADLLSPSPLLYVNCLDLDNQSYVNSSNLACCRFLTVMGHVRFPKDLRERFFACFCDQKH